MTRNRIAAQGWALLSLALCLLINQPAPVLAYSGIMDAWQSYYNTCGDLNAASCTACHQNGFDYNPYGAALKTSLDGGMSNTEAFVDTENVDSDGDGFTNGQEIVVDCTLPGDASSFGGPVADDTRSWDRVKALYR
jgi:hypothetical protein